MIGTTDKILYYFYKHDIQQKRLRVYTKATHCCRCNTEVVTRRCSVKKMFLEISQNSQENIFARVSFLIKLKASADNFIKKGTLAQVLSCEFCEISKNTFSYKTPPVTASGKMMHCEWYSVTEATTFFSQRNFLWNYFLIKLRKSLKPRRQKDFCMCDDLLIGHWTCWTLLKMNSFICTLSSS